MKEHVVSNNPLYGPLRQPAQVEESAPLSIPTPWGHIEYRIRPTPDHTMKAAIFPANMTISIGLWGVNWTPVLDPMPALVRYQIEAHLRHAHGLARAYYLHEAQFRRACVTAMQSGAELVMMRDTDPYPYQHLYTLAAAMDIALHELKAVKRPEYKPRTNLPRRSQPQFSMEEIRHAYRG